MKIEDVRPQRTGLAAGLRHDDLQLTLETARALQKAGYFFTPQGRVFSSEVYFSSESRHTRLQGDWSSDVCSSDLVPAQRRGDRAAGRGDLGDQRRAAGPARTVLAGERRRPVRARTGRGSGGAGQHDGRGTAAGGGRSR